MSNAEHLPAGWISTPFTSLLDTKSGNSKLIKGTLHSSPKKGLYMGFSASGQDVWLDNYEHEGDAIIVSAVGARCGKAFRASGQWSAIANTHIVKPFPGSCDIDYLFRFINRENFWIKGGSAQPFVKVNATFEQDLLLPPLAEQTRIAAKLDELLAQVDTLKARINGIPALLKRFRQSVLAAAVSGRLTEEWREKVALIPQKKIGDIFQIISGPAFKKSQYSLEGSRLLQIANIGYGTTIWDATSYIPPDLAELESKFKLQVGDIVMALNRPITNGTLKVAKLTNQDMPATLYQRVARFRSKISHPLSEQFIFLCLRTDEFRKQVEKNLQGSDQPYINTSSLTELEIYYPELEEQTEIVRRVEQLFAFADQLEAKVASAKSRIDHLTQSILAKAFRGELVPQDPNDEPASRLLERIKAQRAAAPKAKRGRKASA